MKDLHSNLLPVQALSPAIRTASADGDAINLQGFNSLEFSALIGVGGITFTGTNKLGLKMEESLDGTAFMAVKADDILGAESVTDGVVIEFKTAHAAATVHNFGYIGSKQFVRLSPVFSGTHATGTPLAISAIKGNALYAPVQ